MNNKIQRLPLLLLLCAIVSCSKNNDPGFTPQGFWHGPAFTYHAGILNSPNGQSRLYLQIKNNDTAQSVVKLNGSFTVTNNRFKATYKLDDDNLVYVESTTLSAAQLNGFITTSYSGEAIAFTFYKQQ